MRVGPRAGLAVFAFAVAALWTAVLARNELSGRASVLDRLESSLVDLRILAFGPRPAPDSVAIVAIDDDAVRQAGVFPIPRSMLATAVLHLLAGGAKAVILDLLFLAPATGQEDQALAAALASGHTAIAAFMGFSASSNAGTATSASATCNRPIAPLRRAAADGVANISLDASGTVRHIPMLLRCGDGVLPALPLRGASLAQGRAPAFTPDAVMLGSAETPLDVNQSLALRYYGPEGTIETRSLAEVLDPQATAGFARGRTIVIGATAQGVGDRYPTPFDSVLPGVEIVATGVANLLANDALERTSRIRQIDAACIVLLGFAVTGGILAPNVAVGLACAGLLFVIWLGAVLIGFAHGLWFAMASPLAAMAPLAALAGSGRLAVDRWSETHLRRQQLALAAFQPPAMLVRMLADPNFLAEPVERTVAVLFIDISGYTGLSERLDLRQTRDLLKQWHEIVEAVSAGAGGIVANFMADGAMIVWGMVDPGPDDARHAVEAALRLAERTRHWLGAVEGQTGALDIKVGGHHGTAVLSRLGVATHQHITAIGDTINVASRLMGIAAENHATVALSAALIAEAERQGLANAENLFSPVRLVPLRGRSLPLAVRIGRGAMRGGSTCILNPERDGVPS